MPVPKIKICYVRVMQPPGWHTEWMEWMSHRKRRETKQEPSMLPSPAVPGCCLVSFHFLCDIHYIHSVQRSVNLWVRKCVKNLAKCELIRAQTPERYLFKSTRLQGYTSVPSRDTQSVSSRDTNVYFQRMSFGIHYVSYSKP